MIFSEGKKCDLKPNIYALLLLNSTVMKKILLLITKMFEIGLSNTRVMHFEP